MQVISGTRSSCVHIIEGSRQRAYPAAKISLPSIPHFHCATYIVCLYFMLYLNMDLSRSFLVVELRGVVVENSSRDH
jgi:hypothetical protein